MSAPARAAEATLELLDPAKITVRNIRQAKPSQRLIDSIRENGVRQPIGVLRTPDGELVLRFGDRRRQACMEVGCDVQAIVIEGTAGTPDAELDRIFEQLDENDNREDLTAGDRAAAVEALFTLGATVAVVTRKTGLGKDEIAAARTAAASQTARTLAAQYPLDLAQAAVIAEFDDDPETATELAETARDIPSRFAHEAQRARDQRADAAAIAAHAAGLAEKGITVVTERPDYNNNINSWASSAGKQLTEKNHKDCPGNVVLLYMAGFNTRKVGESWYCTDPKGNGHKHLTGSGKPETNKEEATAERRKVIANNKAWRSATVVRQQWIRDILLARKTVPAGAAAFTARAIAETDYALTRVMSGAAGTRHALARTWLGVAGDKYLNGAYTTNLADTLNGVSEQRAQMITLTLITGAYEEVASEADGWRNQRQVTRQYLAALASWGYPPSEIEQGLIDGDAKK